MVAKVALSTWRLRQAPVLVGLVVLLFLGTPALAQQAPTLLTFAAVSEPSPAEARVVLSFGSDPGPQYRIDGNDRTHVEVRLSNTRNVAADSAGLPISSLQMGLTRSTQIRPDGGDLVLAFDSAAPLHVVPTLGRRSLTLALSAAGGQPVAQTADARVATPASPVASTLPEFVDPQPGQDGYSLVRLKYADVSEIVGLLANGIRIKSNDSFTPMEPGFGSPGATSSSTYNPSQSPTSQDEPPLGEAIDTSIAVDRRLNAIWIRGSQEHIARVKAQIAAIDVPVDTVVLETQFVELTESGARNIGIDLTNSAGQIAVATFQVGQYVPTLNYPVNSDRVASVSFQAALNVQIQKGQGKIVSRPRIAAQSGSSAKIITGDALPILTSITLSGVNGVSQQVQYVNVGVTLQIAPRVTGDGFVSSHIFCVVSSVSGYSQGYPTISQRHAETSASVRDGESFIIGGLSQESALTSRSRPPLLGDLPLLGQLFNTEKSNSSKTDLYIVITPHVVRHVPVERGDG